MKLFRLAMTIYRYKSVTSQPRCIHLSILTANWVEETESPKFSMVDLLKVFTWLLEGCEKLLYSGFFDGGLELMGLSGSD